jgi:hypothetical protein
MPFNTVVTNVPGPPVHIYSAGSRMESMALSLICLTDGMGLAHVVQSYVDEAYISFTACRDIVPDPEFYAQCLQDSFDDLLAAAKAVDAKAAKPAAKKPAAKKPGAKSAPAKKASAKAAPAKKAPVRKTAAKPRAASKPKAKAPAKRAPRTETKKTTSAKAGVKTPQETK